MKIRLIAVFFLLLNTVLAFAQDERPNIIFILSDDLGYGDVSSINENSKILTPNIDRLAQSGITFTDAHTSSSVCTPSRYGILTGRYNWRSILKKGVLGFYGKSIIESERTTMASMLKDKGYATACIGKWHLGFEWATTDGQTPQDKADRNNLDYSAKLKGGPTDLGFDYYFGVDAPNYPPYAYIHNDKIVGKPNEYFTFEKELDSRPGTGVKGWKQVDVMPTLQKKTIDYIAKAARKRKPFFMYLPLTGPHTPVVPTEEFLGQSGLNIYADFVMQVDAYVGNILDALEQNGLAENTLVVFTSDNGCSPHADFEELARLGHDPSYIFRGTKADIYEGGHRVACFLRWPEKIKQPQIIDEPISMVDFMATFASIVQYTFKDDEAEDSFDLSGLLFKQPKPSPKRESLVMHSINGSFSIRKGHWKLEMCPGSGGWSFPRPGKQTEDLARIQLYDLREDIAETQNVASVHPEVVEALRSELKKIVGNGRSTPGKAQENDGTFIAERMQWMAP
ncbi:arylsulfatase [Marinilongibacter aquaticus]|uniref:sulfatase family protein n=1 Tax=Marinilongibacter aquaticus TaxID=2975157 RepID=UPI0021BD30DF|nr:arylsulfatase [Marinilongibacter aquaticus]UBM59087.1 arylsulfatase [Marinilongibacter aquaticus]